MIPNILSIAGSDPSGGAGVQADIKAISANGGYAMAALTALTAQNTQGVRAVDLVRPEMVAAQIAAIREDIRIDAVKIGMLGTAELISAVAEAIKGLSVPVVLDPVMVAKGGDRLLAAEAVTALREVMLPRATVITPNLPEAADLLGCAVAQSRSEMRDQARGLRVMGARAVYLKGGHLGGEASPDLLLDGSGETWIEGLRLPTANTHGTGCTLSSALATQLVRAPTLITAARAARAYTHRAICAADGLSVGHGHGPLDHFFAARG
ncbi:hydroxymethylpyrimidine kinase /phosphomethylpyrimidine kinase [Rhodobacter sp. JA431]|uniref:bifunctional hydroxymethylpyrimidine kinase/phosphomethylpyrimidine kinase n=1 Tax=Rhodobacter sp. JA431 TaxID=570013 RepID=UPI000BDD7821|nr:bifunctional hydroxymethylpyrimidine kinase/phosphomethylpyrimidine kinase [Rhodobacter sp. JA431]SOB99785.1 hydroxymethylpyrimidine kinase /phosphomethylpyrimidine kinase [Rhodobacter sp. JA431]